MVPFFESSLSLRLRTAIQVDSRDISIPFRTNEKAQYGKERPQALCCEQALCSFSSQHAIQNVNREEANQNTAKCLSFPVYRASQLNPPFPGCHLHRNDVCSVQRRILCVHACRCRATSVSIREL